MELWKKPCLPRPLTPASSPMVLPRLTPAQQGHNKAGQTKIGRRMPRSWGRKEPMASTTRLHNYGSRYPGRVLPPPRQTHHSQTRRSRICQGRRRQRWFLIGDRGQEPRWRTRGERNQGLPSPGRQVCRRQLGMGGRIRKCHSQEVHRLEEADPATTDPRTHRMHVSFFPGFRFSKFPWVCILLKLFLSHSHVGYCNANL
jgi:hypothetical protein